MRGIVGGLTSAAPLALQLPAVLQDDEFAQRFVSAFDVALAPVIATLDDLHAYVDPWLAPADFLAWLAEWVGLQADVEFVPGWDLPTRREVVARAVAGFRRDATAGGIRDAVQRVTGGRVSVSDSGGATWSVAPGAPLPGDDSASLTVRVVTDAPAEGLDVVRRRVERLVAAMKPAHVIATVEVSGR